MAASRIGSRTSCCLRALSSSRRTVLTDVVSPTRGSCGGGPLSWRTRQRSHDGVRSLARHYSTQSPSEAATEALVEEIKSLMRNSAQPVAIITAFLPRGDDDDAAQPRPPSRQHLVHGATLSSFTTISLDTVPLVAFSLKLPSRMADTLQEELDRRRRRCDAAGPDAAPHFIVNVLSSEQAQLAEAFAKPGLQPLLWPPPNPCRRENQGSAGATTPPASHPFDGHLPASALAESPHITRHAVQEDQGTDPSAMVGLPFLTESLGSLACSLSTSLELNSLVQADAVPSGRTVDENADAAAAGSRLFIARVHAVETEAPTAAVHRGEGGGDVGKRPGGDADSSTPTTKPLVYWQRKFTSVE